MTALFWCLVLANVVAQGWFWRAGDGRALAVACVTWVAATAVWVLA